MIDTICLHDRQVIAAVLQRDPLLHLYAIGDLDDFFWPYTNWYALLAHGQIRQIVLAYTATPTLILHALCAGPTDEMRLLLQRIIRLLPRRLYAHLSGDLITAFQEDYAVHPQGQHLKMALTDQVRLASIDTAGVVPLTSADHAEIAALYQASYPGNWFDPRMLATGRYYGLRAAGRLISIAGVHVYAPRYGVAALGNITTHPQARGRGYATRVTARLCQELLRDTPHIGLNVKADNASALACYTHLGFTPVATYGEYALAGI